MSLRGRVLRRKYSEWTLEPKSIQSQRQQLASLLETFRINPAAAISGAMTYVRDNLVASGSFIGTFPYPDIYPSNISTNLPIATTQWARFGYYWQYGGRGVATSASYFIGYIVVDVTTNPKQPRIKASADIRCASTTSSVIMETIIPRSNGAYVVYASSDNTATPFFESEGATFSADDEFYVAMAFCQNPCPVNSSGACLSYYVEPESVLKPQLG